MLNIKLKHTRRTHIIPHHLKGVKQNIKKILTYFKLIVFLVQYAIRIRISLDFCGNGNRKESDFLLLKKEGNQKKPCFLVLIFNKRRKPRSYIHRLPLFCEVVKYYE